MKRDWSLLQVILAHFETETIEKFINDMETPRKWVEGQYFSDRCRELEEDEKAQRVIFEHIRLLIDGGFVDGIEIRGGARGNDYSYGIYNPRLTNEGHDLLQAMRSNKLWEKVKGLAQQTGVEISMQTLQYLIPSALKNILG